MRKSSLLSLLVLLPTVVSAEVLWKGDFETGNTSQWTKEEMVNTNRLVVTPERAREGAFALRTQVEQGDRPIRASGNRNELVYVGDEYYPENAEGAELYYSWSTLFDESFPSEDTWQVFTQWHHTGLSGSPPVEFYVLGEEMRMRVGGERAQDLWSAPLQRGVWHDFIVHVKWSSDPNQGFVELYYNGQLAVPRTPMATMYPGDGVYLKQGLYRNASIAATGVVFHDGFTVATELADVLPAAPQAVAAAPTPGAPPAAPPAETAPEYPAADLPTTPGPEQTAPTYGPAPSAQSSACGLGVPPEQCPGAEGGSMYPYPQ